MSEGEFFDDGVYAAGLETARAILDGERAVATLTAEQGKLQTQKAALAPWLALNVPLDAEGSDSVSLVFGTAPAKADFAAMEAAAAQASELSCLYYAGADQDLHYFLLLCHKSVEDVCVEAMRPFGFSRANLRGYEGTAADNDRQLDNRLKALEGKIAEAKAHVASYGGERANLKLCVDISANMMPKNSAKNGMMKGLGSSPL